MKSKSILVIDSREQKSLEPEFRKELFGEVRVEGLPFGDYWFWNEYEDGTNDTYPITFERKSFGDLFGTMTSGYERFKKEIQKARENNFTLILLIEGSMRTVGKGYEHSQFSGEAMLKKLATLRVKYDLEYHFFNDRREMARFIEEIFLAIARLYRKEKKNGNRDVRQNEGGENQEGDGEL